MEVFGTVASVIALMKLVAQLREKAYADPNARKEVESCCIVLSGVAYSFEIIHTLSSGPEPAPALIVEIQGQSQNVVEVCSERIESIIKDVQELVKKFAIARKNPNPFTNWAARLRSRSKSSETKVKPQRIRNLVEEAKVLERSLHFAMSSLIYAKMGASHTDWQQTFKDMIERFEKSQQAWRAETSSIGVYTTTMRAEHSTTSQPLQDVSETEGGSDHEASRNSPGALILVNESSSLSEGLESETEMVAEIFDDGRVVPYSYYNAGEEHDTTHAETTSESETGDTDTPIEIETDALTHEPEASDHEIQCTRRLSNETTEISRSGSVFLDAATNIASCWSDDTNAFRFCVHHLSVQDDGQFTAMLREPCCPAIGPCHHISLHWREDSLRTVKLPVMFDVTVRQGQILSNADLSEQAERADVPILCFLPSCSNRDMHTLIYMLEGARTGYAAPNSDFTIMQSWPANSEDEDSAEEEELNGNNDEANSDLGEDNEERQDEGDRNTAKCGIGNYTAVPCFFCGRDALQPTMSAEGSWGILIYRNDSIGYNCSRCEKRTWVSGGEWTLAPPGGTWNTW
ncbi:uncharacterized protein BDZ99DRAFT_503730 [Mytilinidion resinicola]|uniref:Fungal N-terminal domain-containing protein n=1 Tax=Mytilinidion resinicola TaxID=574789 RepID=A0A6A6Y422_9PEZI|nr:uncharacterized protein BDZ99DRAFT_503730 [Mytilinidion resinicola]KAF2802774.1 hypothetical protein BDZ99DRAFT_503730 [Mytilinidion resinicola]